MPTSHRIKYEDLVRDLHEGLALINPARQTSSHSASSFGSWKPEFENVSGTRRLAGRRVHRAGSIDGLGKLAVFRQ